MQTYLMGLLAFSVGWLSGHFSAPHCKNCPERPIPATPAPVVQPASLEGRAEKLRLPIEALWSQPKPEQITL